MVLIVAAVVALVLLYMLSLAREFMGATIVAALAIAAILAGCALQGWVDLDRPVLLAVGRPGRRWHPVRRRPGLRHHPPARGRCQRYRRDPSLRRRNAISTSTLQKPVVVFVYGQQGLFGGVNVAGQKITERGDR